METKETSESQGLRSWTWLLLFVVLGAMVFLFWQLSPSNAFNIPYSSFVEQAEAGNVARVRIAGDKITGAFVEPVPARTLGVEAGVAQVQPAQAVNAGTRTNPPQAEPPSLTEFRTVYPEAVGDEGLMAILASKDVRVDVASPGISWPLLLLNGLPILLIIGLFLWMRRRPAADGSSGYLNFTRSKARRYGDQQSVVTFDDVAGADEAKADLAEVVDFLRHPARYRDIGARIPRGVLLVGPPGTGKTLLARAVAGEAHAPFFNLSASEFVEMFVGVGAGRVRDLFQQAKAASPAIVFIDEMDAVGRRRGAGIGNVNDEREQTLNQLLVEMDGFDERSEVIVIAATNRADVLDPALLRPGRFDRQVTVGLPDRRGREGILAVHTRSLPLAPDVDLALMARKTIGFSGADLANVCNEAAILTARETRTEITLDDFEEAVDKVMMGDVRLLLLNEHDRKIIAYHEAGHAVAAWMTAAADPVHKVTIVPRGQALGVTAQLPGEDRYNYTRTYLMARLLVMLGGRAAEELALGDITTGAENDLKQATFLARRMIARWGMGSIGLTAFDGNGGGEPALGWDGMGREYSETMATRIDEDVDRLLAASHGAVCDLLTSQRAKLDALAQALLSDETVGYEQLVTILGPRDEVALFTPS